MKQTAVEWLIDKILIQQQLHTDKEGDWIDIPRISYINAYKDHVDLIEFAEKAKEIEKQQIIDSYASGYIDGVAQNKITAEQYYKETFEI